jgi:hypothetical protein
MRAQHASSRFSGLPSSPGEGVIVLCGEAALRFYANLD